MKKADLEILAPKLPVLQEKINEFLIQEGLQDFEIKTLRLENRNRPSRKRCPEGQELVLVAEGNGFKEVCR